MAEQKKSKNRLIDRPVVVLVEGADYVYSLLSQTDYDEKEYGEIRLFDFVDGKRLLGETLADILKNGLFLTGGVRAVGIISDIEHNGREAKATSIRDALKKNKLPIPKSEMQIEPSTDLMKPATAYLLIPHGKDTGCLDHALLDACTLPSEYMQCADDFCKAIMKIKNPAVPNPNYEAKLKVHALVTGSGDDPGRTLGNSAHGKGSIWDFQKPSLNVMIKFIKQLRDYRPAGANP
jgi:hypothetical protein